MIYVEKNHHAGKEDFQWESSFKPRTTNQFEWEFAIQIGSLFVVSFGKEWKILLDSPHNKGCDVIRVGEFIPTAKFDVFISAMGRYRNDSIQNKED